MLPAFLPLAWDTVRCVNSWRQCPLAQHLPRWALCYALGLERLPGPRRGDDAWRDPRRRGSVNRRRSEGAQKHVAEEWEALLQRAKAISPTGPVRGRRCADGVPQAAPAHADRQPGLARPDVFCQAMHGDIMLSLTESQEASELDQDSVIVGRRVWQHLLGRHGSQQVVSAGGGAEVQQEPRNLRARRVP